MPGVMEVWWCTPVNPSTREAEAGRSQVWDQPPNTVRPCIKKIKFKKMFKKEKIKNSYKERQHRASHLSQFQF
jgi:hypothetical protein